MFFSSDLRFDRFLEVRVSRLGWSWKLMSGQRPPGLQPASQSLCTHVATLRVLLPPQTLLSSAVPPSKLSDPKATKVIPC